MAIHFNRWVKDPFFSPAEEVQESSDRMESTYNKWIAACKDESGGNWNKDQIHRDLLTALGTAKWQLEQFELAVTSSYQKNVADEAKDRHQQFIITIKEKISLAEKSLKESSTLFNSCLDIKIDSGNRNERSRKSVSYVSELHLMDYNGRNGNASADIGWLNIAVSEDRLKYASSCNNGQLDIRVPSYLGFVNTTESAASKLKTPFRKWKAGDRRTEDDDISLLDPQDLSVGTNGCNERRENGPNIGDEECDKQQCRWYGTLERLLERSHYQVHGPMNFTCCTAIILFFIVFYILRAV